MIERHDDHDQAAERVQGLDPRAPSAHASSVPHCATDVDFRGYEPFDAGVTGPLRNAPRDLAERHFDRLIAARDQRRAALAALWRANGGHGGDAALDAPDAPAVIGAWLARELGAADAPFAGRDAPLWTGVVADLALWLGERIIAASGGAIRWTLLTSPKKATGYQRPVLTGFRKVDHPSYYVDLAHLVASWAELAAKRRPIKPDFLATIEQVTLRDA